MKDKGEEKLDLFPEPDIFSISLQNALKYYFGNLHPSVVSASEGISGLTVIVGETIPTDYIKEEIY
jgi:hypothetical protein